MMRDGYCHSCSYTWDAAQSLMGYAPYRGMPCPKCKSLKTTYSTDEDDDHKRDAYERSHPDFEDGDC